MSEKRYFIEIRTRGQSLLLDSTIGFNAGEYHHAFFVEAEDAEEASKKGLNMFEKCLGNLDLDVASLEVIEKD